MRPIATTPTDFFRSGLCAASIIGLSVCCCPALAQSYATGAPRILSDPLYLPVGGEFYGDTEFDYQTTHLTVFNPMGAETETDRQGETIYRQTVGYGVTDALSVFVSGSYVPSLHTEAIFLSGDTVSRAHYSGFTDPKITLTYRVLDQVRVPVVLDALASYSPNILPAYDPVAHEVGTVATGSNSYNFELRLGHEWPKLSLSGDFQAMQQGQSNVRYVDTHDLISRIDSYWTYGVGTQAQWRPNAIPVYFDVGGSLLFGYAFNQHDIFDGVFRNVHNGGTAAVQAGFDYPIISRVLVGSFQYQHTFSDNRSNDFVTDPSKDFSVAFNGTNLFMLSLQYAVQ